MKTNIHYSETKKNFKKIAFELDGFYDSKGKNNLKQSIWQNLVRRRAIHYLKETGVTDAVADIGCGNGDFSYTLRSVLPLENIYSFDFVEESINIARTQFCATGIHYCVGDLRNIPFKSKAISTTLCINALHHIFEEDHKECLEELARITKSYIIIEIKNKDFIGNKHFRKITYKGAPTGLQPYPTTIKEIEKIFSSNKFRILKKSNIFLFNLISPIVVILLKRI